MVVFHDERDYLLYKALLLEACGRHRVEILCYCLMPNHVHLIARPLAAPSLARSLGLAHQRFAAIVHRRNEWTGHLWQARFYSCPLDDLHFIRAVRYVVTNPVRAGLVERPEEWPFSSAKHHLLGEPDPLVTPGLDRTELDWRQLLSDCLAPDDLDQVRRMTRAGTVNPPGQPGRPRSKGRLSGLEEPFGARPSADSAASNEGV